MLKSAGIILTAAILLLSANGFSQPKEDINTIDSISFSLYNSSKWESLLDYFESRTSLVKSNYYFIMRRGIAYYSKEDYVSAASDFEGAIKIDPMQDTPKEYLYYCYLNLGKRSDADILASGFSPGLKKKIKYSSPKFFSGIYTEHSYADGSRIKGLSGQNQFQSYPLVIQGAPSNYIYNNIGLIHSFGNRVRLYHSYSRFSFKNTKIYTIENYPKTSFDLSSTENDYYAWLNINAGNGFTIGGGFRYMSINSEDVNLVLNGPSQPVFTNVSGKIEEFSAGVSLSKSAGRFAISLSGNISNMNSAKQFQTGLNLAYMPLGNLNLYLILNSELCMNKLQDSTASSRMVIEPKIGLRITDHIWAEAYYTIGEIYNFTEGNLFTVFNNSQTINRRFGLDLILPVKYNKLELSLRYQYLNLLQSNAYFADPVNYELRISNQSLNKITGGVKWIF